MGVRHVHVPERGRRGGVRDLRQVAARRRHTAAALGRPRVSRLHARQRARRQAVRRVRH